MLGDSRAWGDAGGGALSGDSSSSTGAYEKSLAPSIGLINLAVPGDRASLFLASHTNRLALAIYASDFIIEYGINDLTLDSRTAVQLAADISSIIALLPPGSKIVTTLEPKSASTDSWATLANQTTNAANAERVSYNANVRGGSIAGQTGYFEVADIAESSRNSGKWKVTGGANGYTADGLHANASGISLIVDSGIIDARIFRKMPDLPRRIATPDEIFFGSSNSTITPSEARQAAQPRLLALANGWQNF